MNRYDSKHTHSYLHGLYSSHKKAVEAGEIEKSWRAGKYEPEVKIFMIDVPEEEEHVEWHKKCTS